MNHFEKQALEGLSQRNLTTDLKRLALRSAINEQVYFEQVETNHPSVEVEEELPVVFGHPFQPGINIQSSVKRIKRVMLTEEQRVKRAGRVVAMMPTQEVATLGEDEALSLADRLISACGLETVLKLFKKENSDPNSEE